MGSPNTASEVNVLKPCMEAEWRDTATIASTNFSQYSFEDRAYATTVEGLSSYTNTVRPPTPCGRVGWPSSSTDVFLRRGSMRRDSQPPAPVPAADTERWMLRLRPCLSPDAARVFVSAGRIVEQVKVRWGCGKEHAATCRATFEPLGIGVVVVSQTPVATSTHASRPLHAAIPAPTQARKAP